MNLRAFSINCREFALGDPERQALAANVVGEGILIERRYVCQGFSVWQTDEKDPYALGKDEL